MQPPVVIVGAGLAGLCCARSLAQREVPYLLLEASDRVGGRVRTDAVDGFLLDRGFQVLLSSYPEAQRVLDYAALDLRAFEPGALVQFEGSLHRVTDPFRRPLRALASLFSPIGGLSDKLRVAALRRSALSGSAGSLLERPETTTVESLARRGFSDAMIDRFFRPFFGGVFLESELETSSRWFELLFRLFALGSATLPARGMEEIPRQLVAGLDPERVRTSAPVVEVGENEVITTTGERIAASAVVIAAEEPAARSLVGETSRVRWRSVSCLYFAAAESPISGQELVLGGEPGGRVNNLCVPSALSEHYAPEGQHLVSVTVIDALDEPEDELEETVREQLAGWFGADVGSWRHLKSYRIEHALPAQAPGEFQPRRATKRHPSGAFFCGDYCATSSIQGAMVSGRKTAAAVAATFSERRPA